MEARTPLTPVRVAAVMPEPTPYRSPLFDLVAGRSELELTVVYSAGAIAGNDWQLQPAHPHVLLRGRRLPGAARVLRHDYPVTPGIVPELERLRPQCVVVSGWSTFASQAAILWCRARRVPYVLLVESHDADPRAGWRRAVKGTVVPRVVRDASSVLVAGTLARESMLARGARPERIRVFANTIDVEEFSAEAGRVRREHDGVVVLCVARLAREKGIDVLLRAAAEAAGELHVVLVGGGPDRPALEEFAGSLGVRATFRGVLARDALVEQYAAADVFALLSRHEPWGVVVNEAAACGLPLVLSEHVGAHRDLLRAGENGFLVPPDDVGAAAAAFRTLARDPALRRRYGEASRRLVAGWGYGPSADAFVAAVLEAVSTLAA
jgi:glycosyltransferase involved in cell wall biosynthesis